MINADSADSGISKRNFASNNEHWPTLTAPTAVFNGKIWESANALPLDRNCIGIALPLSINIGQH